MTNGYEFRITPADVGRKAIRRDGEVVEVEGWDRHNTWRGIPHPAMSDSSYYMENGKFNGEHSQPSIFDLIAWADDLKPGSEWVHKAGGVVRILDLVGTSVGVNNLTYKLVGNYDLEEFLADHYLKPQEITTMSEAFDWTKFYEALKSSTNICSGAKADIEKAIKAGKGGKVVKPEAGQVWESSGGYYMPTTEDRVVSVWRKDGAEPGVLMSGPADHAELKLDGEYVAANIKEFFAKVQAGEVVL